MGLTLGNGVRFALNGRWTNARPIITTWHAIVVTSGNRYTGVYEAAGAVGSAWAQHVCPVMPNNYTLESVGYVDLATEDGSSGEFVLTPAAQGANASSSAPPNIGVQVTKQIADKGRTKRPGRIFLPGGNELNVDEDGVISAGQLPIIANAVQAFHNEVNGYNGPNVSSMRLQVAHTPSVSEAKTVTRKVPAKEGLMSSSDITGYQVEAVGTGIQRRVQTS